MCSVIPKQCCPAMAKDREGTRKTSSMALLRALELGPFKVYFIQMRMVTLRQQIFHVLSYAHSPIFYMYIYIMGAHS